MQQVSPRVPVVKIEQQPLRDLIKNQLIDLIAQGEMPVGARLTEADLAARLGVSRIPVREALQALSQDGWVDLLPRQGARVHVPTLKEVEDVFGVRAALESECARLAAQSLGSDEAQRLAELIERGHAVARAGDNVAASEANADFHRLITQSAGNLLMADILGRLELRIRWYFTHVAAVRGVQSWVEHQRILDAMIGRDADLAALESRRHTEATLDVYRRYHRDSNRD
jgi:DNA-binding GntR family transcriptional regulator